MADNKDVKPHFYLGSTGKPEAYTSPSSGGGSKVVIPEQNRQQHGGKLINQLLQTEELQSVLHQEAEAYDLQLPVGIQVEFESFPVNLNMKNKEILDNLRAFVEAEHEANFAKLYEV